MNDDEKKLSPEIIEHLEDKTDVESDYDFARDNYKRLINISLEAIDGAAELAKESEHPRAFEVLFNGIKHAADINDKLLEHQRRKQVVDTNDGVQKQLAKDEDRAQIAFEGSTDDLLKAINKLKAAEAAPIIEAEYQEVEEKEIEDDGGQE